MVTILRMNSFFMRFSYGRRVYEKEWRDNDVHVYISPAYSSQFHPDEWWKHRADSRTFFYEFSKIVWYAFAE